MKTMRNFHQSTKKMVVWTATFDGATREGVACTGSQASANSNSDNMWCDMELPQPKTLKSCSVQSFKVSKAIQCGDLTKTGQLHNLQGTEKRFTLHQWLMKQFSNLMETECKCFVLME